MSDDLNTLNKVYELVMFNPNPWMDEIARVY